MLDYTTLAFMRTIASTPEDDSPRLILSDYLDECTGVLSCEHYRDDDPEVAARVVWSRMIRAGMLAREPRPLGVVFPPLGERCRA